MSWISLCPTDQVPHDGGKYVEIDGFHLGVYRLGDEFFAMDDTCPHAGASLSAGHIDQDAIVCPRHNWCFILRNGQLRGMEGVTISTYPTRVFKREGHADLLQADLPVF
jgi:nitrite reductase/ring-hydroxylating ferredoxin subunit